MLDDRDYMRQPEFGNSRWLPNFALRWPVTVGFLAVYTLFFLAELCLPKPPPYQADFFSTYLALSNVGLAHGYVWQLVTYQFLHANFFHLFFNGWAIYMFGTSLETELGRGRFVALMFSSGILGGAFQAVLTLLAPHFFPDAPVVGASACAFGLVAAYAMLYPERELAMLVFFVIPVTVAAKVLLFVSAAMAALGVVLGMFYPSRVANAAHLGGILMGWVFVKFILHSNWSRLSDSPSAGEKHRSRRQTHESAEPVEDTELLQKQVDVILDKISAQGIKSLTARERETLESARKRMTKS